MHGCGLAAAQAADELKGDHGWSDLAVL